MNRSKFCSNCGNTIQSDSKFCGGCGKSVQSEVSKTTATSSQLKRNSKIPHLIISLILSVFVLVMGKMVEEVIIRGGGLEEILIIPVFIIILQITLFYYQTRQKSKYPIIPTIASLCVVFKHTLELISLKEFISQYPEMDSAYFAAEISLTIVTIFGFAFLIVVNIISMLLKNKSLQPTTRKKVS